MKTVRLSEQEYVDNCNVLCDEYVRQVKSGEIITGKYIKLAVEKYLKDLYLVDKWEYKQKKVDKVFAFLSFINLEHNNQWIQFPILPYQCFFISILFGFYYKDTSKRKYKEALLFIGKGNGKTPFAAALQLYSMLWEGFSTPQSILLAITGKQALNALNYAKGIIINSPVLRGKLIGQRYRIVFDKKYSQSLGFSEIMSTVEPARLTGYKPTTTIMDEIHGFKDSGVLNAIRTSSFKTQNSMILSITTAGNKEFAFCQEYLQQHKEILEGHIDNENSIALIYQPDSDDDLADSSNWIKANPSLGSILHIEDLKIDFNNAKYSIKDQYEFITTRLNVFFDSPDTWIPEEDIKPCFTNFDPKFLEGHSCYVGVDLSKNTDMSSVVLLFPEPDKFYVIPYFFIANNPASLIRDDGKDLTEWINQGNIIKCETKVIDLDLIYNKIVELSKIYNIQSLMYDRYNAISLIYKLNDVGINTIDFPQNARKFNAPLKTIQGLIYEKKIEMLNPVLKYNFMNVRLYIDSNANIKVIKNKQNSSVDGIISLAEAMGAWIDDTFNDETLALSAFGQASTK